MTLKNRYKAAIFLLTAFGTSFKYISVQSDANINVVFRDI